MLTIEPGVVVGIHVLATKIVAGTPDGDTGVVVKFVPTQVAPDCVEVDRHWFDRRPDIFCTKDDAVVLLLNTEEWVQDTRYSQDRSFRYKFEGKLIARVSDVALQDGTPDAVCFRCKFRITIHTVRDTGHGNQSWAHRVVHNFPDVE
jgi:hypothetical protein